VTPLDAWRTIGLRGTASDSCSVDDGAALPQYKQSV
jgi:hypothetical protein